MKKLIHSLVLVLVLSVSAISFEGVAQAKNCKKGKACGNTCIAQDAVCSTDSAKPAKPAKNCKKGKACGNTCIAKDAECKAESK